MTDFSTGDRVRWNTPQGETEGRVVERRTTDFQLANRHFTASDEEPMFIVESEKSGARAAHRPEALTRI
jgi:hypothetical protein